MTAAVALAAGGGWPTSIRLGLAMVALQLSIGTLNDLLDAGRDAGRVPPKPIPAGLVPVRTARVVWLGTATIGLLLAAPSGFATVAVAVIGLSVGYAYDRFARGTAWSWVPFAVGIPLVPIFGWVGTGAPLPWVFAVLVPCAMLAGAAIAIANAAADLERDMAAGSDSVAVRLGPVRAWQATVVLVAVPLMVMLGALATAGVAGSAMVGTLGALAVVGVGLAFGRTTGRRVATPAQRQRGWEVLAAGMGLFALVWLLALRPQ